MKFAINPYIRRAWNHQWYADFVMERVIYDHEIIYIDKGKMKFTIDKKIYIADEGSCVILPPNKLHKIEGLVDETFQPHVHFDFFELEDSKEVPILTSLISNMTEDEKKYFRRNFFQENCIHIPYVIKLQNPLRIRKIMFDIIETYAQQKPYSELALKGLLINLVVAILEDYNQSKEEANLAMQNENIYNLVSYLINNINHNFTLEEMAKYANMTVWNLIQSFNKLYKTTPKKFFEKYRLLHAKTLLQLKNMQIKEIAYEMEFESPQTFTRWFKNIDGNNPTYYQKSKKR